MTINPYQPPRAKLGKRRPIVDFWGWLTCWYLFAAAILFVNFYAVVQMRLNMNPDEFWELYARLALISLAVWLIGGIPVIERLWERHKNT